MATLAQKFDALHAAEESVRKAYADLTDPSTGEAITAKDAPTVDNKTGRVFWIADGKLVNRKGNFVGEKPA